MQSRGKYLLRPGRTQPGFGLYSKSLSASAFFGLPIHYLGSRRAAEKNCGTGVLFWAQFFLGLLVVVGACFPQKNLYGGFFPGNSGSIRTFFCIFCMAVPMLYVHAPGWMVQLDPRSITTGRPWVWGLVVQREGTPIPAQTPSPSSRGPLDEGLGPCGCGAIAVRKTSWLSG